MEENEVLKNVVDTVAQESITFDIDIFPQNLLDQLLQRIGIKKRKKSFSINPLTLNQINKVSKLLITVEIKDLTPDGILKIMNEYSYICAEIVAVAVTASRQNPSKKLINLFYFNLSKNDMSLALKIVLQQMNVLNFITTIASIRSLSILETRKPASATTASKKEANPQTQGSEIAPGILSVAS